MSSARQPDISVVVPSVTGWESLADCLTALSRQEGVGRVEVIVVDRLGQALRERLRHLFPDVRVLGAEPGTPIPRLRAMGFNAALAGVVGVIEDHVLVPPDWAALMLAAHRAGARVVGGAVVNAARATLSDRAAFLCEYSHCLVPPPPGPAAWVTGNNVTYDRRLLEAFRDVVARGGWEHELHEAIRTSGVPLTSRPDIRVAHKLHCTVPEYAGQRYLYSRAFAALRLAGASVARRVGYGLAALALPPVLLWRIVRRAWASPEYRHELLPALPLLCVYVCSWAGGEAVGAWRGVGDALARVR